MRRFVSIIQSVCLLVTSIHVIVNADCVYPYPILTNDYVKSDNAISEDDYIKENISRFHIVGNTYKRTAPETTIGYPYTYIYTPKSYYIKLPKGKLLIKKGNNLYDIYRNEREYKRNSNLRHIKKPVKSRNGKRSRSCQNNKKHVKS